MEHQAKWIWFVGDFEIYHGMKQNFEREERGYGWPAYWKMDDWNKNVYFYRSYELTSPQDMIVHGHGTGHVLVNGKKFPLEQCIQLDKGKNDIQVMIGDMTGLPCIFIDCGVVRTDETWTASDFIEKIPAGTSSLYTDVHRNPNEVWYEEEDVLPKIITEKDGGLLFDFARLVNGPVVVSLSGVDEVSVCYGESAEEATDTTWCYYSSDHVKDGQVLRKRAFRYLFLPDVREGQAECRAVHQMVQIPVRASFSSSDPLLDKIWAVAAETYRQCSGIFFIDGAKRDRWIWSGDAYQSYFVNPYIFFDPEINRRTTRALRGKTDIVQHINTIVDYSMLWLLSIENQYKTYGDIAFVREMYPKMEAMMKLLMSQINEYGFIYGRENDWIYIDWAEMDKEGPICAEQMLLLACYRSMAFCGSLLNLDVTAYEEAADKLQRNIMAWYWDEEKSAFISSYESGIRQVTRHANIFAILFDLVDEEMQQRIFVHVLLNPDIPELTTPYFKFYELDVWGKMGRLSELLTLIREYWGGMLDRGAVTFWEQFNPRETGAAQYAMYGDPFGKSLCHAWAASPIYLLGRYFLGVRPTSPGYKTYCVEPQLDFFDKIDAVVPVGERSVHILYENGELTVTD